MFLDLLITRINWLLKKVYIALSVLIFSLPYAYAAESNNLTTGIAAYNKGWYSTALHYLTVAEPQYPNDATLHYYRANALVYLMQVPQAVKEYSDAAELDPNGLIGQYAREAINECSANRASISAVANPPEQFKDVIDYNPQVIRAQDAVLRQGSSLSDDLMGRGQTRASGRVTEGQESYDRIHHEEAVTAKNMRKAGSLVQDMYGNSTWMAAYTAGDIAAYKAEKEAEANNALNTAQYDAGSISTRAYQRASSIKDTAIALAQQLADPQLQGDAKLAPLGTNLYVRNYIVTPDTK